MVRAVETQESVTMWDAMFGFVFGDKEPVYVTLRDGQVAYSEELIEGVVIADFREDGVLLGIEVIR